MGETPQLDTDEEKCRARKIFDDCAEHYDMERERTPYFRAQLAILLSMLSGESGRILDIGCAAGGEIGELRAWGFSVVGLDLSFRMLEFARRRFASDNAVHLCRADIERLPFANQSMDHVVCLGVFEFLPDYRAALREIHRVLRTGGLAVFAIPSAVSSYNLTRLMVEASLAPAWRAAKRALGRSPAVHVDTSFPRKLCVPWKYRALLRRSGFLPGQSRYSNFFLYPLDRFPELNLRVAAVLEPLCSVPLLRCGASVYMLSARKK